MDLPRRRTMRPRAMTVKWPRVVACGVPQPLPGSRDRGGCHPILHLGGFLLTMLESSFFFRRPSPCSSTLVVPRPPGKPHFQCHPRLNRCPPISYMTDDG
jgi:hypothetical protein